MAKPELNPAPAPSGTDRAPERPWLKSYPKDVDWGMDLEPVLLTSLLDRAVAAYGPLACTYFMGKRLSFAEIGSLSDRAAKGLQALGVQRRRQGWAPDAQLASLRRLLLRHPQGRRHGRQFQSPLQPGGARAPGPRQRHQDHGDARPCRHLRQGRGAARRRRHRQGGGGELCLAPAAAQSDRHEAQARAEAPDNRFLAAEGQDRRRAGFARQ